MLALMLAVLPPFVAMRLRRWRGQKLDPSASIAWLAYVDVGRLAMARGARIGSFAVVRAERLSMGRDARIRSLSIVSTHTVELGEAVHVAPTAVVYASRSNPRARLAVGDHSRIFPFCWIEPGEGIELGRHVGIGGHGLIFTHGSWSDYLDGGPVVYAPVKIEDRVWLPWRVTVQAGVTIGAGSIVLSGAVVTKSLPANVLAGGAPAKAIRELAPDGPSSEQRVARAEEIVVAFERWHVETFGASSGVRVGIDRADDLGPGDLLFVVAGRIQPFEHDRLRVAGVAILDHPTLTFYDAGPGPSREFADFVQRFGIRLYRR